MKKRVLSLVLAAVMLITFVPVVHAEIVDSGQCGDAVYWELDSEGTLTISGEGDMWDYYSSTSWDSNRIGIKSIVIENGITNIGACAFSDCIGLTSVTIPDSVTHIGDRTFEGCDNLSSITIPNNVTQIGNEAFCRCNILTNIIIPDSVTSIGYDVVDDTAYYKNEDHWINNILYIGNHLIEIREGLQSYYLIKEGTLSIADFACYNNYWVEQPITVSIPDSVTNIGYGAFRSWNLTSINVDDNNKIYSSKDGNLFNKNKTELIQYAKGNQRVSYIIPNSVTKIDEFAFNESVLTQIIIPNSVTNIGEGAFSTCRNLTTITIPDSVTEMGEKTFGGCSSLISVTFNAKNCVSNNSLGFDSCTELTSVTIGEEVTNIPRAAFENCKKLTSITIPACVDSIGDVAFYGCNELTNATILNGVKHIGDGSFENCSSLTNITIPNSVISIGLEAFKNCSNLTSVNFNAENCTYDRNYDECPVFSNCTALATLTIGEEVTNIPDYMFKNCTGLKKVNFNAKNFTSHMSQTAFMYCSSLTTIEICKGVTTIPIYAFRNCGGVTRVSIPDSITSIGYAAFSLCDKLNDVYYGGTQEQWQEISSNAGISSDATIHYSSGKPYTPVNVNPPKPNDGNTRYNYGIGGGGVNKKEQDPREYLKECAEKFNKAALEYTAAVSKSAKSQAGTEGDVEALAKKLEAEYNKQPGKRILFTSTPDAKTKRAAFMGYAKWLNQMIEEGGRLDKINLSDNSVMIDYKLTSQILSKLRRKNLSYSYNGYNITINGLFMFSANFGNMEITPPKGNKIHATLVSDPNQTMADLQDFANQLKDVAQDVNKKALRAVIGDLVNLTNIRELGTLIAKDGLKSYKPLTKLGFGNVVKNVKKCYSGYEAVKDILNCTNIETLDDIIEKPEKLSKKLASLCENEADIENAVVNAAQNKLINSLYNLLSASQGYEEMRNGKQPTFAERVKEFFEKTTSWVSSIFQCPVDFTVYDENGEMIGFVEDGAVYYNDDIYIEISEDVKTLYVPVGMKVNINMTGTDEGEFNYTVEEVIYNQPTGRLNYYGLPLSAGTEYTQNLDTTEFDNRTDVLPIASQDGDVLPNEYISSEDTTAYVIINADSGIGGTALGGGEYAKGDSVELSTVLINSNYEFNGWYVEDELVSTDRIYRFTAIENTDIHAEFMRVYHQDNAYEMGFSDAESNGYTYIYKDGDGSKGVVVVPFAEDTADTMQIYVTTYSADGSVMNEDVSCMAALDENGLYAFENLDFEHAARIVIKDGSNTEIASADYDSSKEVTGIAIEVSDKYSDSLNVTAREEFGNVIVNFDILGNAINQNDMIAYLVEYDESGIFLNCTILDKTITERGMVFDVWLEDNNKLIFWDNTMCPITEAITMNLFEV